jgi:predicted acylesterase/phospholipase RssA/CRP-like cAMP-binding protein
MSENQNILSSSLSALFQNIDQAGINEILEQSSIIELKPGDYLIKQGENTNTLYFIISGRLRSIKNDGNSVKILGDVGAGEPLGELSFFTDNTRSASVVAIRKSKALALNKANFETIVTHQPALAGLITQFVIKRLSRNSLETHKQSPPKNIAIVKLDPEADFSSYTDQMLDYFGDQRIKLNIYEHDSTSEQEYDVFFESLENNEGLNLFLVDKNNIEWSKHCLIYSDLVIVASAFDSSPRLRSIENSLDLYNDGILGKKAYLLLLHEDASELPKGTSQWLANRHVSLNIHIRKNNLDDIGRFCRILTHKANGLVLGGGGAKGFAHIGVVKALKEKGIPIDFVGGTSAGGLYGLTMAFCDFDMDKVEEICRDSVKQKITSNGMDVPLVSIMSGKKLTRFIKHLFKEKHIEDIWINTFCVSTNFSKAEMAVHERGLIWSRVRASISIPGIFPPVVIDRYLHVDGAVMDNLPIEPMYRFPVDEIYAVSLSGLQDIKTNYDNVPSSKKLLLAKLSGRRKYKVPGITSIIINSLTINSRQKQEQTKNKVSHYLELDLKGVNFLDNKKWKSIINQGYEQTKDWLEKINVDVLKNNTSH